MNESMNGGELHAPGSVENVTCKHFMGDSDICSDLGLLKIDFGPYTNLSFVSVSFDADEVVHLCVRDEDSGKLLSWEIPKCEGNDLYDDLGSTETRERILKWSILIPDMPLKKVILILDRDRGLRVLANNPHMTEMCYTQLSRHFMPTILKARLQGIV